MTLARSAPRRRKATPVVLATLVAPLLMAPIAAAAQTTEDNRRIVGEAYEGWARGDNIFAQLLAEDVVWTIHGSDPVAGTYVGREDFVERALVPFVSRLVTPTRPEVHRIWAEDDTVVVRFSGSATTTSGAPYSNEFVWIFTLEDGKVVRAEAFLDLDAYRTVLEHNEPRD